MVVEPSVSDEVLLISLAIARERGSYVLLLRTHHTKKCIIDTQEQGLLKFIYSEKATKICRNLLICFDNTTYVITDKFWIFSSNFSGPLGQYEL